MVRHEKASSTTGAVRDRAGASRRSPLRAVAILAGLCACAAGPRLVHAADPDDTAVGSERFAVHGQATVVEQATDAFRAPYAGSNSLSPRIGRETADATLFVGIRLSPRSQLWLSPEIDQGFGLDDTLGVAGFPSGEAYKVGSRTPYLRLPRAFLRTTWNLGGADQPVDTDTMQLRGTTTTNRLVVTLGKFSVTDVFDTNRHAHDPRGDFLNWAAIDAATFDYAADAWGYTVGAAAEWYRGAWTLRSGVFDLSDVPNSARLEPGFHEYQTVAEVERRYAIAGRPGRWLVTGYDSRARMGLLSEAVARAEATGTPIDIASVRRLRDRAGVGIAVEQGVGGAVGVFARAGAASGNVEAYEFTDVDRTIAVGASFDGSRWHRTGDTWALALMSNGISAARERYLAAGGLGILVGDGRLPHPGSERIVESYYEAAVGAHGALTLDYQHVWNPAYNRDRGPVAIYAVRLHAQF